MQRISSGEGESVASTDRFAESSYVPGVTIVIKCLSVEVECLMSSVVPLVAFRTPMAGECRLKRTRLSVALAFTSWEAVLYIVTHTLGFPAGMPPAVAPSPIHRVLSSVVYASSP